ncbi:MAG: class I SAM-dependent methyltransferase [Planctomycetota bacterium]
MNKITIFILRYFYAAISCLYLFSIGFLNYKNYPLLTTICAHFGYSPKKAISHIIPTIKLTEIASDDTTISIQEPIAIAGNVSLLELIVLNKLIRIHKPGKIFEIGTFDGRTTLNMAANCSEGAKLYTLDLPSSELYSTKLPIIYGDRFYIDKKTSGSRYISKPYADKITQLYGDSATFDFSPYFNTIDFIFIDGSHSYEYVLNDTSVAMKLLNDGKGLILWHDYIMEEVNKALNELYTGHDKRFERLKHIEGTSLVSLGIFA